MPEDSVQHLYEEFLDYLKNGSKTTFSEDDLLDVYDYATDIGDEYVRLEVLFFAARHRPNSLALKMRRAWYYYDKGCPDGAANVLGGTEILPPSAGKRSRLEDLLKLNLMDGNQQDMIGYLKNILSLGRPIKNDEEIIRLVETATRPEIYAWFKDNFDAFRKHCAFHDTLLSETVEVAKSRKDYDFAIPLAEELTAIEPFNIDFWNMLADLHYLTGNYQAVMSDAEFALAITPDDLLAQTYYAAALANVGTDDVKAMKLLINVIHQHKTVDIDCAYLLCRVLERQGRISEAYDIFYPLMTEDSGNSLLAEVLLKVVVSECPQKLSEVIEFIKANPGVFPLVFLQNCTRELYNFQHYDAVAELIMALDLPLVDMLVESLYRLKRYDDLLSYVAPSYQFSSPLDNIDLCIILTLIRKGKREDALEMARHLVERERDNKESSFDNVLVVNALRQIAEALTADINAPADSFDPFV